MAVTTRSRSTGADGTRTTINNDTTSHNNRNNFVHGDTNVAVASIDLDERNENGNITSNDNEGINHPSNNYSSNNSSNVSSSTSSWTVSSGNNGTNPSYQNTVSSGNNGSDLSSYHNTNTRSQRRRTNDNDGSETTTTLSICCLPNTQGMAVNAAELQQRKQRILARNARMQTTQSSPNNNKFITMPDMERLLKEHGSLVPRNQSKVRKENKLPLDKITVMTYNGAVVLTCTKTCQDGADMLLNDETLTGKQGETYKDILTIGTSSTIERLSDVLQAHGGTLYERLGRSGVHPRDGTLWNLLQIQVHKNGPYSHSELGWGRDDVVTSYEEALRALLDNNSIVNYVDGRVLCTTDIAHLYDRVGKQLGKCLDTAYDAGQVAYFMRMYNMHREALRALPPRSSLATIQKEMSITFARTLDANMTSFSGYSHISPRQDEITRDGGIVSGDRIDMKVAQKSIKLYVLPLPSRDLVTVEVKVVDAILMKCTEYKNKTRQQALQFILDICKYMYEYICCIHLIITKSDVNTTYIYTILLVHSSKEEKRKMLWREYKAALETAFPEGVVYNIGEYFGVVDN